MSRKGIMLCVPFSEERLRKWTPPYLVQPKIDGDRCITQSGILISSQGNVINNLMHINRELKERGLASVPLDGELYRHGWKHQDIHSVVSRTVNPHPDSYKIQYHIFDIRLNFVDQRGRIQAVERLAEYVAGSQIIYLVPSYWAYSLSDVMSYLEQFMAEGYEGIIVRDSGGFYLDRRSTQMMKYKPFKKDVYKVIGTQQEVDKDGFVKDSLGAFICQGDDGAVFNVGTGPLLTLEGRSSLWKNREDLVGYNLEVKYQALTKAGKPRFPVACAILPCEPLSTESKELKQER